MAAKKVGDLIREARTAAGLTQAGLAKAAGVTASDISKAELNAPKGAAKASKTEGAKTGKTAKASEGEKLTAAEKKLVDLYRAADSDTKKAAVSLLKGEKQEGGILGSLFSSAVDTLIGGKK